MSTTKKIGRSELGSELTPAYLSYQNHLKVLAKITGNSVRTAVTSTEQVNGASA